MNRSVDELADRLRAISEEITDLAIDSLRESLRRGESKRPASERSLTQARRAVEKAEHLLRSMETTSTDE
jgi:hypothetical protein